MSSAVVVGTSAGAALPGLPEEATASREEVTCTTHPSSSGCAHSEHKQFPFKTIQVFMSNVFMSEKFDSYHIALQIVTWHEKC